MACQLSWGRHPDNLKIAVLAHRAVIHGHPIRVTPDGYAGGDGLAAAARHFGLASAARTLSNNAVLLRVPRIVLFCGACIGYPYYAYYAHSLWSLGLAYSHATAADIASGILDDADVLIIPGGFANWGLDRAEDHDGVDRGIEDFLRQGGAMIGSCGGAYYASQGRPGWLGRIDAKPVFTHEYLQTGAAVLNVQLTDAALRSDLPETLELAYYHGPVYEDQNRLSKTLARYAGYVLPSRLFIDNPLERARYETMMQGRPAILAGHATQGRIIVFSPHPEMGDFVRKGIALDGYVRRYLPLRGFKTMDETLHFYAQEDCLGFRLILNALLCLGAFGNPPKTELRADSAPAGSVCGDLAAVLKNIKVIRQRGSELLQSRLAAEEPEMASLIQKDLDRQQEQWRALTESMNDRLSAGHADQHMLKELAYVLGDAAAFLESASGLSVIDTAVALELPVRLIAASDRLLRCDEIIKETM